MQVWWSPALLENIRLAWNRIAVIINYLRNFYNTSPIDLYYKHITIVNDDSRVVSKWRSKLWCRFLTTLEVSFMLLESSFMLLENIYSTGIYNHHIFIVQATGFNIVKLFLCRCHKKILGLSCLEPTKFAPLWKQTLFKYLLENIQVFSPNVKKLWL